MSSGRNRDKKEGQSSFAKYIIPLVVLTIVCAGVWYILKEPEITSIQRINDVKPIEPEDSGIVATIYIDNSSSMKGYADGQAPNNFIDVLADLRAFYPNTNAIIGNTSINGDSLIDMIHRHKIEYSHESLLYNDLKLIAEKAVEALNDTVNPQLQLNFYITDGIMSGSDKQIASTSSRDYNKIHAQDLQNQIQDALLDKDDIGVSVYQFISNYSGSYWTYKNDNKYISTGRYFYIFAVGSRNVIAGFKCKVDEAQKDKSSKFHPLAQWHAIDPVSVNTYLTVGPSGAVKEKSGVYSYSPKVMNRQHRGNINFNLDVQAFVNHFVEDMEILAQKSFVEIDQRRYENIPIVWDEQGHCFSFSVPVKNLGKKSTVRLSVPQLEPNWISMSSNDDDSYMLGNHPDARTFLFDKLMNGVRKAIAGAKNEYIFQREIILVQE